MPRASLLVFIPRVFLSTHTSLTHSQTLPAMSWQPYGLTPWGKLPTGSLPLEGEEVFGSRHDRPLVSPSRWLMFASPSRNSFPQGNTRPSVPRAAFSHSALVGRRRLAQRQKASASRLSTNVTGKSSSPAG